MKVFDWKKNRDVGVHLDEFLSEEEYQRAAVNRFYYSCFGPSKDYYGDSFRKNLPNDHAHSILINELKNSPFLEEQELGSKLKYLRRLRNQADYNAKSQEFKIESTKKLVDEIFSIIDNLYLTPIRLMRK